MSYRVFCACHGDSECIMSKPSDKAYLVPYAYSILSLIIYDVNLRGHISYVWYLEDDCVK